MKFIAVEFDIPDITEEQIKPLLKKESQRVLELYEEGIIREIYFKKEKNNAVLILECNDQDQAELILQTLPLVKEKLINFEISQLVHYSGFSRLLI
jgi:muconolactone delta-isomerase